MAIKHQLPKVLKTYLPWYTPHDIPMTNEMKQIAKEYSETAVRTS